MKYIDRDNFRHLTGFGRDFATVVDHTVGSDNTCVPGNLIVKNDTDTGNIYSQFIPFENNSEDHNIGGYRATCPMMLSLILQRNEMCEITSLLMAMVLLGTSDVSSLHQVYRHDFVEDALGQRIDGGCYIGVTKRGWRARWSEHLRSANTGSNYRFHRAIRQWHGAARVVSHTVVACGLSEDAALTIEEVLVEQESLYPLGLNMVPGGRAGLAYLRKIGAIGARERVGADDRQAVVNRFFENASRKGLSNPLAAANWLDSNYSERVLCSGADRLKSTQIRDARFMSSMGVDAVTIAVKVGARNVAQIQRVLSGSTYSRIL